MGLGGAAGVERRRFNVLKGGFNLNWIAFTTEPVVSLAHPGARSARRIEAVRGRLERVSATGLEVDASGRLFR